MSSPVWSLRLAKEDFKFSVAHFTLFGPQAAEPLHGHNYRLSLTVAGRQLDDAGLLVGAARVKELARALCAELDDRILLPTESPWLAIRQADGSVECEYAERHYRFPAAEVLLLPLANTSMELLARFAWERLAGGPELAGLDSLAVEIAETAGQSCRYSAPLTDRAGDPATR
ncbi:MAG: hypothetical protein F9K18_09330 [Thermoanaerobaculia bacterium]|nr:MAG: hypothetical protein F9K18_09330 [Thermoanaerobaculia bacterium]MBZ0102404.1 6-carboxytetrahydropterin synthase [Thermoanaerobaculia bacterium]